jgi:threonine synthase
LRVHECSRTKGLFIPHAIPLLSAEDISKLEGLSFQDLAIEIFTRYISETDIPREDLRKIVAKSYATFRTEDVTPTVTLDQKKNLYLLELFHGPTFAFKDVALQFVGNLFEYFLVRRNQNKSVAEREHLTVIGATSGDTGSAAIYGLRGKKDVCTALILLSTKWLIILRCLSSSCIRRARSVLSKKHK